MARLRALQVRAEEQAATYFTPVDCGGTDPAGKCLEPPLIDPVSRPRQEPAMTCPFQLQGHRGARGLFPENTIEGLSRAIALGLRCFEIDVGVLRDNTVVVHHDLALNQDLARTPGGNWLPVTGPLLRQIDWEELQDYDVGCIRPQSLYAAQFPTQAPIEGARIPRLLDVLRIDPAILWTIELKLQPDRPDWSLSPGEMADRVMAVVDEAGAGGRVILQSFDWRAPRHIRATRPDIATGWLTAAETAADPQTWWDVLPSTDIPTAIAQEGGQVWTPQHTELTLDSLRQARSLGLQVIPWTVNEPLDMERLIAWGVDGLITDYPDRALPIVAAAGLQPAAMSIHPR